MKFRSFTIKNFKGIKEATIDLGNGEAAIHTLVGLNESGKTTILEAINMFSPDISGVHAIAQNSAIEINKEQLIPKSKKSDFTGNITIEGKVSVTENDKNAIKNLSLSKFGLMIDPDSIPSEISISNNLSYDNSRFIKQQNLWDFRPLLKTKRQKTFKEFGANTQEWQAFVKLMTSRLPRIIYFPNFLFEFPGKILISTKPDQSNDKNSETNEYFVGIIEDALGSLIPPMELRKHIVDRVQNTNAEFSFSDFMTYWFGSSEKDSVEAVLENLAGKITEEVFGRWSQILGKDLGNSEIEVISSIEYPDNANEREVYLTIRVKQGKGRYKISERSLGFRWFFCFLLFTRFMKGKIEDQSVVFLFDEPASNLHSKAQTKLLESLDAISGEKNSIIFSTHSHHLINPLWLESAHIVSNGLDPEHDLSGDMVNIADEINISVIPYKRFVGMYEEKGHYFQPILDRLDFAPSSLDVQDCNVLVEGKSDYYILNWYKKHHAPDLKLNFLPISGVTSAAAVISLMLGWCKNFVLLHDSDDEGKSAQQRYMRKLPIGENHFVEYEDVFGIDKSAPKEIEDLLSEKDKQMIAGHFRTTQWTKKQVQRIFAADLVSSNKIEIDPVTLGHMKVLTAHLTDKLEKQESHS